MLKIGILLITFATIILFYLIKDVIKKDYPNEFRIRVIYGILGVTIIILCIGLSLIMQYFFGFRWPINLIF